jgi:hypothetical protein
VPAARIEELLRMASVCGFEVLPASAGIWPKLRHKETDVGIGILSEGATPGTRSNPAPTTIPHPSLLGAKPGRLYYIGLNGLVELKLAAARARDESDVVELLRANPDQVDAVWKYIAKVNERYARRFDELSARAKEQTDR